MGTEHIASHYRVAGRISFRTLCFLLLVWKPLPAQADPADQARRNASEGLQAALAELQQAAGPDQRVTARASILDANTARPHLTGVWQSWEIDPANNPPDPGDYSPGRETKFMKWLVSHQDAGATGAMSLPQAPADDGAVLLGHGTLGPDVVDPRDIVEGGKVPATDPDGSFAWVVLDEGVKARINTPFKNDGVPVLSAESTMELGAGERPRTELIDGLFALQEDWFDSDSPMFAELSGGLNGDDFMAGLNQLSPGIRSQLKRLSHEASYYSMGLFCDVARGGLKKDFHLMTNGEGLPAEIANQKVYASQLGLGGEASDPYWQYLADFANLRADSIAGLPSLQADVPVNYTPYSTVSGSPSDPNKVAVIGQPGAGTLHLPTIARIQFIFGIFAEPLTPSSPSGDPTNTHRLNMTYKPVVTLHNPYNVALKFDDLKISFNNLPFAVQFTVKKQNGAYTTTGLRAFDQISRSQFELKIRTASVGNGLQPGEVRVFAADAGFQKDTVIGRKPINMIPGFDPYNGTYRLERLAPVNGFVDFKSSDLIGIQIAPRAYTPWSGNRFAVTMDLKDGRKAAVIEMDYKTPTGIEVAMGDNQNFPLILEDMPANFVIAASQAGEPPPFAEFSFRARTTSLGGAGVLENEPHPGKPWSFAHAISGVERHRFDTSHPADHSHEFGLQAINSIEDTGISIDPSGRGYFISGNTPELGVKFGALHDIPLAPIQSFSTLNGADPTGVSGFMPRFAQPIGNSWAHPLIPSNKLREPNPSGDSDYLDHSYLLNLALYDHFYFSGLADQRNNPWFRSPLSPSQVAAQFSSGLPLDDPRVLFYRPNGQKSADFVKLIEENPQDDAYRRVPAWQMMKGAFNVNSTSVEAWKAMLASVHDSEAPFLNAENMQIDTLREKSPGEARISRFRLPGSGSFDDTRDPKAYWLGPREYSPNEISELAERIVDQVRERGPFLSMGDFVNRRLTSGNSEHARCGALQQAIDLTNINSGLAIDADAGGEIPFSAINDNPYYKFRKAAEGASYQGAPGCLSQADLLTVLGNAATVRSDTFTIRAYGESRNESGQIIESAWCEAVVQRIPDWLDPTDAAEVHPDQLTSETNRTLGRRFRLIAFRWLDPNDV